jgi:hypothetical protein
MKADTSRGRLSRSVQPWPDGSVVRHGRKAGIPSVILLLMATTLGVAPDGRLWSALARNGVLRGVKRAGCRIELDRRDAGQRGK